MDLSKAPSPIRSALICGALGLLLLTAAVPAGAVIYAYDSPLSFLWDDASGVIDHYNVYISVDGEPFELLQYADTNTCQVDVEDGHSYVVQVEAEDAEGRVGPMSDPSEEVAVFLNGAQNDTDGDGMSNAWEAAYGLNPFDPNDANLDPDADGFTNIDEFEAQTDPSDPDTDDDGVRDGDDLDPLDATNNRPMADAGEDQELDPTVVTLDGSASYDPNADLLSYTWTQKEGPEVALSDSHAVSPAFLGTEAGEYVFELVVGDGGEESLPDQVVVVIRNVSPAADAGKDREAFAGTLVALDGSGSADPNGDVLSLAWSQSSGTPVTLQGDSGTAASFVPIQPGVYSFQLVTYDGHFFSPPDEVQVIVNTSTDSVPAADAGEDQTVKTGDAVILDGSGSSDPEGNPLSYSWSQVEGPETVVLEDASAEQARFVAPVAGLYRFQLIVDDGQLASPPDRVFVNVESAGNQAPVVSIVGVDPVRVGDWVILDGSGSFDPDLDPLAYDWSQTGGPQVMLEDADQAVAGFYAVTEGTLTFALVVHDGEDGSIPASAALQVTLPPPTGSVRPAQYEADSGDGGGCSVGLRATRYRNVDATDIGYMITLFLPAMGAVWYQKRRYRRRKGFTE